MGLDRSQRSARANAATADTPPAWPSWLRPQGEGVTLTLKVVPRASRNVFAGTEGDALRVRVAAPPVDAAANEALTEFLAGQFGCRRSQVRLLRGATSRHKVVQMDGITAPQVLQRLAALGFPPDTKPASPTRR